MSVTVSQETYPPASPEAVAKVRDFLASGSGTAAPTGSHLFLSGSGSGDQVEIPQNLLEAFVQVVAAMEQGLAVTISPQASTVTTQQAADLLAVSRPTLVRMLDAGLIPYDQPSRHRRMKLEDVLEFRRKRRQEQYAALDAMAYDDET